MRAPIRASVRTTLALVSAAVTSMVAIAFLIPLAVIVRDVARDRAFTSAQLAGAAIEPVLSITTDRETLQFLAGARRVRLLLEGDEDPRPFDIWTDGRRDLAQFATATK